MKDINPLHLSPLIWKKYAALALEEDLGRYDATSISLELDQEIVEAWMNAREDMVVCGALLAAACFQYLDDKVSIEFLKADGEVARTDEHILRIVGRADTILAAERSALNYMQRLSGIATLTREYVERMHSGQEVKARLLDTRKTTPGLRLLEKYATQCGGAVNHRMGLDDMVMIKDNHLVALSKQATNPIQEAVRRVQSRFPGLKIEVEVDHLAQLEEAIKAGPDRILLDNMDQETLKKAVAMIPPTIQTEASGGITLETIADVAATGVDFISAGAITHGAKSVDIGLDFRPGNTA